MDAIAFELGTDGPTRILVGIDGSDTSMRAGAYAAGLARGRVPGWSCCSCGRTRSHRAWP